MQKKRFWVGHNMRTEINLFCLLLVLTFQVSSCFNIDTVKFWNYTTESSSLFGQKVLQYQHGTNKGIYVSSPLQDIKKRIFEGVFKCTVPKGGQNLHCEKMDPFQGRSQAPRVAPYPIISLARNADSTLICQQMKGRKNKSTAGELNGECLLLGTGTGVQTFPDLATTAHNTSKGKNTNNNNNNNNNYGVEETTAVKDNNMEDVDDDDDDVTEIAIVLDGSGSIEKEDFQKAKDFISNMMKMFWEKCTQCDFAVVQYSDVILKEFDLQESRQDSNHALQKVQQIEQVGHVTKTASALQYVLDNIFNEASGSKPKAKKIILVLTDGDIFMDPLNLTTVINSPKMQDVERFAIGVGDAFNKSKTLNELKLIASQEDGHVIRVEDYSALEGLLSSLEQKIIGIEGTKGDKLEFDLAEIGFAVHARNKSFVFGAVGSFDWSGGMLLYQTQHPHKVEFLRETISEDNAKPSKYGYLGYSVTIAQTKIYTFYIAGAPHHSNVGQVIAFEEDITSYHPIYLKGEQLGSYFGFELCTVDIETDGYTDFLLVGAPFYHIQGEEGKVYVYKINSMGNFTLVYTLEQNSYSFARFGYSVASIGDINQDGYQDIAVGAPLEGHLEHPDNFGSVYIYNGKKDGIRRIPSQRITALTFNKQKLQYFGQSIDGGLDLTNDGYPDISVGALASVIVLRSRPVVKITANVRFMPSEIPLILTNDELVVDICFNISPLKTTEMKKTSLKYSLDLDVDMHEKRITFKEDSEKGSLSLIEKNCTRLLLALLPCNYDCFSNIRIKISYTLNADQLRRDLPAPILDMYEPQYTFVELPYVKDCNNKTTCIPILKLITEESGRGLVVGQTKDLTVNFTLINSGDDSYRTTILIAYPNNLQVKIIKTPNSPSIKCSDHKTLQSSLNCDIGHPVFKASNAAFSVVWQLNELKFTEENVIININVSNINNITNLPHHQILLPVKHSFSAVLSAPQVLVVTINQEPARNQEVQYTFDVSTENQYDATIVLSIQVPVTMQSVTISSVKNIQKTQNSTQCEDVTKLCGRDQECGDILYHNIKCNITGREHITVTADLFLSDMAKLVENTKKFLVTGEIIYDKNLFVNLENSEKAQISVMLHKDIPVNLLPVMIGSSIGGILLLLVIVVILVKCGFFERKYKNFDEQEDQTHK
ncbi:integrin alpha-E [Pelobates fuscus]|uniref:integrin alpha-E n=1 Tax=Pelobates fuscus TaxID=191477 RepID=UPI002FE43411